MREHDRRIDSFANRADLLVEHAHRVKSSDNIPFDHGQSRVQLDQTTLALVIRPAHSLGPSTFAGRLADFGTIVRQSQHPTSLVLLQEARCGYIVMILIILWVFEILPLPITSLLPLILFPTVCRPLTRLQSILLSASVGWHPRSGNRLTVVLQKHCCALLWQPVGCLCDRIGKSASASGTARAQLRRNIGGKVRVLSVTDGSKALPSDRSVEPWLG